ncbi:MAG: hypothetical protein IPF99_23905 [Deltaproteobacteria bacterium]|nr:hypothetical protein [Deltaproteobacteria bacterium]
MIARKVERILADASVDGGRGLGAVINETLYHERRRLQGAPDDERSRADGAFHARVRRDLPHATPARQRALVREIVARYVGEITGHFDPRVYRFATRVLPYALSGLMQRFSPSALLGELRGASQLDEHLLLEGEVKGLQGVAALGTVILAPTHSSNLDSLLIGYAIYRMKLPPFLYGAGLNLSNPSPASSCTTSGRTRSTAARPTPLPRDPRKEYATVALEGGATTSSSLAGTRSRSGEIESRVKLGGAWAPGSRVPPQPACGRERRAGLPVVPCTISRTRWCWRRRLAGRAQLPPGDRQVPLRRGRRRVPPGAALVDFLRGIAGLDLRVHVRIGRALDPFGDDVDVGRATSPDPRGRPLDPQRYLLRDGAVIEDPARDAEYTRALGRRLVEAWRRDSVALPTSVLAFALLDVLRRDLAQPDLYRLLRAIGADTPVDTARVEAAVDGLVAELQALERAGRIQLGDGLRTTDGRDVVARGLRGLGAYHATPVVERRGAQLVVLDADLLFFYRNRLEGYGLLGAPRLCPAAGPR